MRREESPANPEKQPGHDDANANPGSGASGPGERAYDEESLVGDDAGAEEPVDPERQSDG
jgi:hypothetical protein